MDKTQTTLIYALRQAIENRTELETLRGALSFVGGYIEGSSGPENKIIADLLNQLLDHYEN